MEIIEEEKELGSVGKTQRIIISRRDTLANDLKNSTVQGLISFIASLAAAGIIIAGFLISFRNAGRGGFIVGILMIGALLMAAFSIVMGILGLKNRHKIRHYMEQRGLVISALCVISLIVMYVRGILIYLG